MDGQAKVFRCPDTGEEKVFVAASHQIDTTTQHNTVYRTKTIVKFFRADDGDRIDEQSDGSFQTRYGVVWVPV